MEMRFLYCTLPVEEFIRRFLQHVLPKGFVKVRHYGLFSPTHRPRLTQARLLLQSQLAVPDPTPHLAKPTATLIVDPPERTLPCPKCGRPMRLIETLLPTRCRSPSPKP